MKEQPGGAGRAGGGSARGDGDDSANHGTSGGSEEDDPAGSQPREGAASREKTRSPEAPDATPPRPTGAARATPPRPMLAQASAERALRSAVRDEPDDWAFEVKWDGARVLASVDSTGARLTSRSGADVTASYPEVAQALVDALAAAPEPSAGDAHARSWTLDGEVVALDAAGRPSFRRLQRRMNVSSAAEVAAARRQVGVQYMAFDLLALDGRSLLGEPYATRRELLEQQVGGAETSLAVPPALDDLDDALGLSRRFRLEGIVAKHRDATYVPGRRSSTWLKVKHVHAQEAVVVGWRPGHGDRGRLLGSLLLAVPDPAVPPTRGVPFGLRYVGRVGSGFTDRERREIVERLAKVERATAPAREVPAADAADARWVTPRDVVEVLLGGWTGDAPGAGSVRHAVWRGWRPDKDPGDVVVEP
ncbi:hypothetical protein GCM10025865_24690 [Paraoerskovia sediminicola]|uniref:DNA ligase (ATP) n=1 Tax=Paraoerskovia sediminicola TaxID=1138587 RepID=A0ABN6XHV1_9CELL|nr:non-homologous end-joining DNA ligase [Paraoerskovia sediminicola]BDZ43170.1 hypothetical protein GCM10025865_24690 [Paraoerskovia sediminicola]